MRALVVVYWVVAATINPIPFRVIPPGSLLCFPSGPIYLHIPRTLPRSYVLCTRRLRGVPTSSRYRFLEPPGRRRPEDRPTGTRFGRAPVIRRTDHPHRSASDRKTFKTVRPRADVPTETICQYYATRVGPTLRLPWCAKPRTRRFPHGMRVPVFGTFAKKK